MPSQAYPDTNWHWYRPTKQWRRYSHRLHRYIYQNTAPSSSTLQSSGSSSNTRQDNSYATTAATTGASSTPWPPQAYAPLLPAPSGQSPFGNAAQLSNYSTSNSVKGKGPDIPDYSQDASFRLAPIGGNSVWDPECGAYVRRASNVSSRALHF